ncbi:EamA family transporter [Erwinia amylovora]
MNLPGLAFALLGLIWGSNFIFMHWASAWITPLQIVQLRVSSGFIPLLIMGIWQRVFHREHWRYAPHLVVMALLATVLYYWAYAAGTARLLSSVSGVISGCIPLFSFLVAAIFLRHEAVTQRKLLGVALVNYQMGAALIILLLLGNFDGMMNITASSKAVFGLVVDWEYSALA